MPLDLTAEATRAGVYIGGSTVLLKLFDFLIRWRHGSRSDHTNDMDITLRRGAELREELRKDLEEARERIDALEADRNDLDTRVRKAERERVTLQNQCDDLRAELRLFRRTRSE
jgi:chromosome segregation ATPase